MPDAPTLIHRRVQLAREGALPQVIGRLASGWAVLGDRQFLPGYSLLLPDPVVPTLNDLDAAGRSMFLLDMAALGDAVLAVMREEGVLRINYSMLGNLEAALHAHVFPRYAGEPEAFGTLPVWLYPPELGEARPFEVERDREVMDRLRAELERLDVVQRGGTRR